MGVWCGVGGGGVCVGCGWVRWCVGGGEWECVGGGCRGVCGLCVCECGEGVW